MLAAAWVSFHWFQTTDTGTGAGIRYHCLGGTDKNLMVSSEVVAFKSSDNWRLSLCAGRGEYGGGGDGVSFSLPSFLWRLGCLTD